MLFTAVRAGEDVVSAVSASAGTDRIDDMALSTGDIDIRLLKISVGMIAKYLLNNTHRNTPRIRWLSFLRESTRPSSVT